jgi:hypothetical protein
VRLFAAPFVFWGWFLALFGVYLEYVFGIECRTYLGVKSCMSYQVWLRHLLSDATSQNMAHVVARLGPRELRRLFDDGAPPSIEGIIRYSDGEARSAA